MKKNKMLTLFISSFMLSAFTFGGGYVIVPLLKKKYVNELKWINEDEMLDLVSIAQSSPGALTINASILVGYKVAGLKGALITVCGAALPPLIIITIISQFYELFMSNPIIQKVLMAMNIGVAAILIDVVYDLAKSALIDFKVYALIMMFITFVLAILNVNIMLIIIFGGVSGYFYFKNHFHIKSNKEEA